MMLFTFEIYGLLSLQRIAKLWRLLWNNIAMYSIHIILFYIVFLSIIYLRQVFHIHYKNFRGKNRKLFKCESSWKLYASSCYLTYTVQCKYKNFNLWHLSVFSCKKHYVWTVTARTDILRTRSIQNK